MELWDLYDKDRQKTGKLHERGKPVPAGYYRLVVHICVFNSRGELLIQRRHNEKSSWPGLWDLSAGGSSVAGDTSRSAASRELFEELGIRHSFEEEAPALTVHFDYGFDDYYLLRTDLDPATLTLQAEEVQEVRWATLGEVMALYREGKFIPYQEKLLELLFSIADVGYAHIREEDANGRRDPR